MHLVSIEYQGGRFRACKGRKTCFVEARADVAKAIVTACLDRTEATLLDAAKKSMGMKPREGCQPKGDDEGEVCQRKDGKTVGFQAAQSMYEVKDTAEDRRPRRAIKGLKVKSTDKKGRPLLPEVYDEELKRIYRLAQTMRNELDKSDEPRFVLEWSLPTEEGC